MTFNNGTLWEKATVKIITGVKAWTGKAAPQKAEDVFGNPLSDWSLKGGDVQVLLETTSTLTIDSLLDITPMGDTPWDSYTSSVPFAAIIAELLNLSIQLEAFYKANNNSNTSVMEAQSLQTSLIQGYELRKVAGQFSALTSSTEADKYQDLVHSMLLNLQGICIRIGANLTYSPNGATSAVSVEKAFEHTVLLLKNVKA
ncbi:MAG: hypothetical protein ACI976_000076 [Aureispira sp.]|jgi:hypothetical protein